MVWVSCENVTAGNWHHRVLAGLTWTWTRGESWLVSGPNGSGKSALAALLTGHLDAVEGGFWRDAAFRSADEAWIGFERQRRLLDWERHIDLSDVSESPDPGTLARDFAGGDEALRRFGLDGKGDRGLKHLSTGELRRACLARAWQRACPFLILDEPFEGLDAGGRRDLAAALTRLQAEGTDLLLLTRDPAAAPDLPWRRWSLDPGPAVTAAPAVPTAAWAPPRGGGPPVLALAGVNAGYGGVAVLTNLTWTVREGERWLVTGPNGSGKSTLLNLISGDHPQVFSNDVRLFGRRRGADLTLAEVRRLAPLVSYAAHLAFRNLFGVTGLEVLASGFAGTVGLWAEPTWDQVAACRALAESWGLAEAARRPWEDLSWGAQRLVLLGRALVTDPPLLLLDEPCQGLDAASRGRVLGLTAAWSAAPGRTLIYVTHQPAELEGAAFRHLSLPQGRSKA